MIDHVYEGMDMTEPDGDGDVVAESHGCPGCNERRMDWLIWQDANMVKCQFCGTVYDPLRQSLNAATCASCEQNIDTTADDTHATENGYLCDQCAYDWQHGGPREEATVRY